MPVKLLFFAGSNRQASLNKRLAKAASSMAAEFGAEVTFIDLKDYEMPLYCGDLEANEGVPEAAKRLAELVQSHDGVFIASPEYNSAFSPLLKNAIDWASRATDKNEPPLVAYKGKFAAIMATSPGGLGGMRGLVFLRMLLGNIGVTVIPDQQAVPSAFSAFDEAGALSDEQTRDKVKGLGKALAVQLLKK